VEFDDLQRTRIAKLQALRDAGIDPYPPRAHRTITNAEAVASFDTREGERHTVDGRVMRRRGQGKINFLNVQDGTGDIQLFVQQNNVGEPAMQWSRTSSILATSCRRRAR